MSRFQQYSRLDYASRRSKSLYTLLAFSAVFLLQPARAQESACQRWGGSATLSNGKLFYSGGWYRSSKAKDSATVAHSLLEMDLAESWDWDDAEMAEVDSAPALYSDKETQPIPILIASNDTIYSVFARTKDISGYSLSSTSSKPSAASLKLENSDFTGLENFVQTQASNTATAYAIGEGEDGIVLASFDMESSTVSTISPAIQQPELPSKGVLQYIPVGEKGALVYFGGMARKSKASFDRIQVFDFSDSIWREQKTTGNSPSITSGDIICSVYAKAADGSSHSIYTFKNSGEVFVLSLPSFVWFQFPVHSGSAPDYEPPRESFNQMASCVVAPGSRSVVFFGVGSKDKASCDKGGGAYVYDLNDLIWKEKFDKTLVGYEIPNQVSRTIGGGPTGGADMKSPERGWSTTGLRKLFGTDDGDSGDGGDSNSSNNDKSNNDGTSTTPGPNADSGTTKQGENQGGGSGGIIGGAVATIAIVGALFAVYICLKRRRGRRGEATSLRSIMSPPIPPNHQAKHMEGQFEYDDNYNKHRHRSSISKFGSLSGDSLSTRWTPDPFKSPFGQDTKHPFSPVSSISRRLTDNSSTLYTPSALLAEAPDTPYSEQFPRTPLSQRFNGHLQISGVKEADSSNLFELPAHLPAKAYTQSRRGSAKMQFGELEGDYNHPIEKGDSDIPEYVAPIEKKLVKKTRISQDTHLDKDAPGIGRPESAVLPANVRSALGYSGSVRVKPGIDRSATDGVIVGKARLERSGSIQSQSRRRSAQAETTPEPKTWSGKAKLVELKRGPSLHKKKEGQPSSPASPDPEGSADGVNRQLKQVTEE